MSGFKPLTDAGAEAREMTRGELLGWLEAEQEYWRRKFERGRITPADHEAEREFRRTMHAYIDLGAGSPTSGTLSTALRGRRNGSWYTPLETFERDGAREWQESEPEADEATDNRTVMTDVLDKAWADIRRRNRSVPRVRVAVTPGKSGSTCGSVMWASDPLLLVDTDTLTLPPLDVFAYLLHQAAHALADAARRSEGQEPSLARRGYYHDKCYRDAAAELGLEVGKDEAGWSRTTLTPAVNARYATTIHSLTNALDGWEPPLPPRRVARPGKNGLVAVCQCSPPRKIRIAESTYELGTIRCETCGGEFTAQPSMEQTRM